MELQLEELLQKQYDLRHGGIKGHYLRWQVYLWLPALNCLYKILILLFIVHYL